MASNHILSDTQEAGEKSTNRTDPENIKIRDEVAYSDVTKAIINMFHVLERRKIQEDMKK